MKESDLYAPVKAYLQAQGYEVKAEIGDCDALGRRASDGMIVAVEMKLGFTLALVMQGVARQAMFDHVYLAVPVPAKGWVQRYKDVVALCRRLGLGLLAVRDGGVEAHLDPAPYQPRGNKAKAGRLLREFDRRVGDPNLGGIGGVKKMTAYRQDALRCLAVLASGPGKAAAVAKAAGVTRAQGILHHDHYGWFERVARGTYSLTPQGRLALELAAGDLGTLGLDAGLGAAL